MASDLTTSPRTIGIQDIPQTTLNGGLPAFGINGLATLGSNAFLPSDEVSSTFQLTDSVTKIYRQAHLQGRLRIPARQILHSCSHLGRAVNSTTTAAFTDVVQRQLRQHRPRGLPPDSFDVRRDGRSGWTLRCRSNRRRHLGGSSNIFISNISLTDNGKNYYGGFVQDDWKITPKLTINLGLRYDFFGLVLNTIRHQANFVPSGAPLRGPAYIFRPDHSTAGTTIVPELHQPCWPVRRHRPTSSSPNKYGGGLGNSQGNNFAPRVGFAYQATPKLVVRGGFGMFYNGFENRGFSPELGRKLSVPVQLQLLSQRNNVSPYVFQDPNNPGPCPTAGPGGSGTFETGFLLHPAYSFRLVMPMAWGCAAFSLTTRRLTTWVATLRFNTS